MVHILKIMDTYSASPDEIKMLLESVTCFSFIAWLYIRAGYIIDDGTFDRNSRVPS